MVIASAKSSPEPVAILDGRRPVAAGSIGQAGAGGTAASEARAVIAGGSGEGISERESMKDV